MDGSDDILAIYLLDTFKIFKFIHPNCITILGIVFNLLIHMCLSMKQINYFVLYLFINIRVLTDILDGAIARRYNKKSVLGHILDTFTDQLYIFITGRFIFNQLNILYFNLIFILYLLFVIIKYNILYTHTKLKKSNNLISFITNNSLLINNIFYIFIYIISKFKTVIV